MTKYYIVDTELKRISANGFRASWGYLPSIKSNENPIIGLRFHCGGSDVGVNKIDSTAITNYPEKAETKWEAKSHTQVGHEMNTPANVINVKKFYPYTLKQLKHVLLNMYIERQYNKAKNIDISGEQSDKTYWQMWQPLSPTVKLTVEQNATALKVEVDPRCNEMGGDTGHYYRTNTYVWVYKITEGQQAPTITRFKTAKAYVYNNQKIKNASYYPKVNASTKDKFTIANFGSSTTTTRATDGSGNPKEFDLGTLMTVTGNPPTQSTSIEVIAANEGPSGESYFTRAYHVFARPKTATCAPRNPTSTEVTVDVRYTNQKWHPTDGFVLERQINSRLDSSASGSWTAVDTINGPFSLTTLNYVLSDKGKGNFNPPEDKATWYRVKTWHDNTNNANYGYTSKNQPTLVGKPKSPTVTGEITHSSSTSVTINATINRSSSMDVFTQFCVMSGSTTITQWTNLQGPNGKAESYTKSITITDGMLRGVRLKDTNPSTKKYQIVVRNMTDKNTYGKNIYSTSIKSDDIVSDDMAEQIGLSLETPIIDYVDQRPDGISLLVGWHWSKNDQSTEAKEQGTEIVWTDRPWESTATKNTHRVQDGALLSGEVILDNLDEGVEYNIEVKRYVVVDSETGYSLPARAAGIPQSTPEKPILDARSSVAVGKSITYYWTFADTNDTPQTDAILTIKRGRSDRGRSISISGSQGSYTYQTSEDDIGTVYANVKVRTGGGWSDESDDAETMVAEPPTCIITEAGLLENGILRETPLEVNLDGTGDTYQVVVTCISGSSFARPDGYHRIASGQVIATTESAGGDTEIPCSLVQGAQYRISATSTDSESGLVSEEATLDFTVDWAIHPSIPTGTVEIVDGVAHITATEEARVSIGASDTLNIWRKTTDGAVLCYENAIQGAIYEDLIPPYTWDDCGYILEAVSLNDEVKFEEIPYTYNQNGIMIDWDGGHLEAPWNLDITSRYEREFERTVHLDGTTSGHWGARTLASASITVQSVRDDDDLVVLLKQLANSNGICAVRATHGFLMFGDVTVEMRRSYQDGYLNVSISVTGIDDGGSFNLQYGDANPPIELPGGGA